jgi:hypothetical protein
MKIALLGSAPSSSALAPYKDKSYVEWAQGGMKQYPLAPFVDDYWEIWGCSPGAFGVAPRANRWFEVHRWEPGQSWFSPEYVQWLKAFPGPVYTGRPVAELTNCVVYPIDEIEATFSSYFLTSSLALMFALAILEIEKARIGGDSSVHTIGMWGVDMAANEEWHYQRPGCQFFILEALRRGIEIYIPPESDLLRPMPVYGICEWDPAYIKHTARMRELNQRKEAHMKALQEAQNNLQHLSGATDNMNWEINTWLSPYGLPAGQFIRAIPNTGLGGNTTQAERVEVRQPEAPAPVVRRKRKGNGADQPGAT